MNKTRVIVAGASAIAVATALVGVGTVASADDASGASKGKGGVLSQLEDDGTLTSDEVTAVKAGSFINARRQRSHTMSR